MNKLFHPDSKFMQTLTLVGNLILLNFLWLITSLPVVTIGAATTAMYSVTLKYADNSEEAVLKPYFQAFLCNFKQSTLLWIPVCIVTVILGVDAYYLISRANTVTWALWIPFFVVLAVLTVIITYVFPLIARFETTLRDALRNSLLMFLLHLLKSIGMAGLNLLPWATMLILPKIFAQTSIFWLMFGASAIAYFNSKVLLKIFQRYQPEETEALTEES